MEGPVEEYHPPSTRPWLIGAFVLLGLLVGCCNPWFSVIGFVADVVLHSFDSYSEWEAGVAKEKFMNLLYYPGVVDPPTSKGTAGNDDAEVIKSGIVSLKGMSTASWGHRHQTLWAEVELSSEARDRLWRRMAESSKPFGGMSPGSYPGGNPPPPWWPKAWPAGAFHCDFQRGSGSRGSLCVIYEAQSQKLWVAFY